jgi:hypothetical protein
VLLMPNSKHLTHDISNLVSLITKTKLGLSTMKLGTKPPSLHQRGHIGLSTRAKT